MRKPKFSIILPSHNGAERIDRALISCTDQRFTDYEIIVICDACTDDTEGVAGSFGASVIKGDYHNDGLARNAGLDAAEGEWVLFIDDDDWWLHEYVLTLLDVITTNNPDCDAVFFSIIKRGVGYVAQSEKYCDPLTAGHLWKRSFIGGTRFPNKPYGSDNEFFYKLIRKQPDVIFWDNPMYYYNYMRAGSLSDRHKRGEI